MKIRTMLGLSAIGGALYLHRKHGGEWTVDSFKQSLNDLWSGVEARSKEIGEKAQDKLREAKSRVDEVANNAANRVSAATSTSGYNGPTRR